MFSPTDLILVLITAVCLLSAASNLLAWASRRHDPEVPLFGFSCLLGAVFALATIWCNNAIDLDTYIFRDKWETCSLRCLTILLPWFIAHYADRRPGTYEKFLSLFFLALLPFDIIPNGGPGWGHPNSYPDRWTENGIDA